MYPYVQQAGPQMPMPYQIQSLPHTPLDQPRYVLPPPPPRPIPDIPRTDDFLNQRHSSTPSVVLPIGIPNQCLPPPPSLQHPDDTQLSLPDRGINLATLHQPQAYLPCSRNPSLPLSEVGHPHSETEAPLSQRGRQRAGIVPRSMRDKGVATTSEKRRQLGVG